MKYLNKPFLSTALLLGIALMLSGLLSCDRVPITGRKQLSLINESELIGMAQSNYAEVLQQSQIVTTDQPDAQAIQRVGKRITAAVEAFLKENDLEDRMQGVNWEINLIASDQINAWAMPGGKVAFYTGILPIAQDEGGIAAIMGHEIAHVIARHGNERMSQQLAAELGGAALSAAVSDQPEETQQLFRVAYGAGAGLTTLKYSRTHETEADKMGIIFMAMAGYDPEASIGVWQRMAALGSSNTPGFLSTHPSSEQRILDLQAFMPEAKKVFRPQ